LFLCVSLDVSEGVCLVKIILLGRTAAPILGAAFEARTRDPPERGQRFRAPTPGIRLDYFEEGATHLPLIVGSGLGLVGSCLAFLPTLRIARSWLILRSRGKG
jgi:hypothetical protein